MSINTNPFTFPGIKTRIDVKIDKQVSNTREQRGRNTDSRSLGLQKFDANGILA